MNFFEMLAKFCEGLADEPASGADVLVGEDHLLLL